jgi:hypothetical protein
MENGIVIFELLYNDCSPQKMVTKKKLSFDVVSDLVVASSLSSNQNASAMEVAPVKTPVKCEPSEP